MSFRPVLSFSELFGGCGFALTHVGVGEGEALESGREEGTGLIHFLCASSFLLPQNRIPLRGTVSIKNGKNHWIGT